MKLTTLGIYSFVLFLIFGAKSVTAQETEQESLLRNRLEQRRLELKASLHATNELKNNAKKFPRAKKYPVHRTVTPSQILS